MPEPSEGGNAPRVMFRMSGGDADELYKNFAVSKSVTQTDLGAKTYIIEDSIRQQRWKLTDETKKIAGYNCRKAVTTQKQRMGGSIIRMTTTEGGSTKTDSSKTKMEPKTVDVDVVAWYAEDLVSPVGPENNGSLPGVILQLDINKGETVFTAIEVKSTVNKKELKEPSKGKKVTREAFTKMQMEMMNNMQSGGGRTIRFGN
jgi:GLPGLI family protein